MRRDIKWVHDWIVIYTALQVPFCVYPEYLECQARRLKNEVE